jgi:trans-aconitate methyltransferase
MIGYYITNKATLCAKLINSFCDINIMTTYNWNAKDYKSNSQAQQKWARELIDKLNLTGTEDVLDLGCGDGKVTAEIAQQVYNGSVIGVDSATSMIDLATEQHSQGKYPNLSFKVMDASNLLFEERFDVVFSNAALHWVKHHQPVVDGLFASLRSGGKILLQMGGKGNASDMLSVLQEIQTDSLWQPYFNDFEFPYGFLGTQEYEAMLLAAGFKIKRVELIPKDMEHNGKAGLEGWIRTTWLPYTERVPKEKRDLFIETISTKYIERVAIASDGKVHMAMVRIEVEAEKL